MTATADFEWTRAGVRPVEHAEPDAGAAPVLREIATTNDGRDITRGFVDALAILPPQDTVLAVRGASYTVYEQVLRDDQVASVFQQRRLAVSSREWEVRPGGERRQDKAAAAFLEEQLRHIRWDSVTEKMLFGVFYGYAVAECLWARDGAQVVLDAVKVRKQRRFAFGPDHQPRLITTRQPTGEALPPRKFWTFCTGADNDDDPYGLGLAHWLYWPVFFKRNGLKFWLVFLDKFGQPTAKGTYPPNTPAEERRRLLAALGAIQTDSAVVVPEGMTVELIEAARSGTVDYTALYDRMNAAISKVVLGQTLTTEVGSTGGNRALGEVHMDVRQDLVKADADLVCESFNRSVVRWLTEWNFPNAEPPTVWRAIEEPEDLTERADRDTKVKALGFKPTLAYVQDTYGGEWTETAETRPPVGPGAAGTGDPQFAEAGQDYSTLGVEALGEATDTAVDGLLAAVRTAVAEARSLDEVRERLLAGYPDMTTDVLAAAMQEALAAAALAGHFDVAEEIGAGG